MEYREKKFKSGGDKGKKNWKKENAGRNGNNGRDVNGRPKEIAEEKKRRISSAVQRKKRKKLRKSG